MGAAGLMTKGAAGAEPGWRLVALHSMRDVMCAWLQGKRAACRRLQAVSGTVPRLHETKGSSSCCRLSHVRAAAEDAVRCGRLAPQLAAALLRGRALVAGEWRLCMMALSMYASAKTSPTVALGAQQFRMQVCFLLDTKYEGCEKFSGFSPPVFDAVALENSAVC